ncbi:MAG: alpha/beta hydrolase [Polyangiaceae bacterium]
MVQLVETKGFVAALALLGLSCRPDVPPPGLTLATCVVEGLGRPAQCGFLEVAEDRKAPLGRKVALRVVKLPAERPSEHAPLFMLAGGPGQAASEAYPPMVPIFDDLIRDRDVIWVDQRGTGQSSPLDCETPDELVDHYAPDGLREVAARCAEALKTRPDAPDPRHYGTAEAVEDLDAVRLALGYDRVDLLGGSYGTRLALAYAEAHPEATRSLVLDGVAPRALKIPLPMAADAEKSFAAIAKRCQEDAGCRQAFADPRADLEAVLARLAQDPRVTVTHPRRGGRVSFDLPRDGFTQALRGLLYSAELSSLLPLALADARRGAFDGFVAQTSYFGSAMDGQISMGLFLSVVCSEDVARISDEEVAAQTADTVIGAVMVRDFRAACAAWPAPKTPHGLERPVAVATPTLALSGELDPATPPRWAEAALEPLTGPKKHVVVPGAGHGTMVRSCVPELVAKFLDAPERVASLDTDCLSDVFPSFFIDRAGPAQ